MAKDWPPVSIAETQIEATNLQDRTKRKKKWPNYKALTQDTLHNSLSPPQLQKASQPLSTIKPKLLIPSLKPQRSWDSPLALCGLWAMHSSKRLMYYLI